MSYYLSYHLNRAARRTVPEKKCRFVSARTNRHWLFSSNTFRLGRGARVVCSRENLASRHYHASRVLLAEWDGVEKEFLAMPSLSPTMTQGTIVSWIKNEGDNFKLGDPLAEIETDKSTVSLDATDDGYLAKILVPAHQPNIPIDAPIAVTVKRKEDVSKFANYRLESESPPQKGQKTSVEKKTDEPKKEESDVATSESPSLEGARLFASPRARALAREMQVDLCQVKGTGPNSRVLARDVLKKHEDMQEGATAPSETGPDLRKAQKEPSREAEYPTPSESYVDLSLNTIRRITAERLTMSKTTIPHYYLSVEICLDALLETKRQLQNFLTRETKKPSEPNDGSPSPDGHLKLSINDFIIKAAALTMAKHPVVNSEWRNDYIRQYKDIHINVAINTEYGLLTPVIRHANTKGLEDIASTMAQLISSARKNRLTPAQLSIGTFTISNLGMFGIQQFSAVINPPQAAILAIGSAYDRVVAAENGQFVSKKFIQATLSADHRIVDGAIGAEWLRTFRNLIENPIKFML
ncbi:dihydrolipoyllysine-residue acetyltransferase component of pyruvate dehydrogenase complex, mitochondrial-like [Schistocerca gregaria]|uniref:dihydrolipoyllysine-residue acetyltransferase component of pyruvate dehydrogenase complex, mitochondrial-like n=1 Tax=Schistocerca gregaria TaxID=7010 RepID=UPI00211E24E2|nr:dihydrolipoyllysine-residue acetyltransferase component of pyruvate dehydrogenase complex, mitochondrial-like [Schistocerca gregaria]